MIIPMLCVTIFVILVVWFLLPRVARLMIHTPTAISIFVCLSMVQLMAVFISMRCTLCGHFLQVALTLILVVKIGRAVQQECRTALRSYQQKESTARVASIMENTNLSKQQQVSEIMRQMLTQAQTAGQYFTNDQIKEMTRKVSAEVDLVHQQ